MNLLFYTENIYWDALLNGIKVQHTNVIKSILNHIYPAQDKENVGIVEFNGEKLIDINLNILINDWRFEQICNPASKPIGAAKKWFCLYNKSNDIYFRIEIRWKGNIFDSPQFHTHDDNSLKKKMSEIII